MARHVWERFGSDLNACTQFKYTALTWGEVPRETTRELIVEGFGLAPGPRGRGASSGANTVQFDFSAHTVCVVCRPSEHDF